MTQSEGTSPATIGVAVHRIEVRNRPGVADARAAALVRDAAAAGFRLGAAATARVYLVEADLSREQLDAVKDRLLADPVVEVAMLGSSAAAPGSAVIEVHPLPGVMDPAGQSVREAVRRLLELPDAAAIDVSTARRYDLRGLADAEGERLARRLLANPVIHAIHRAPFHPQRLPHGRAVVFELRRVPVRPLDDEGLMKLSREGHLFLSLDEMRAIREEYRRLRREPTDIELETLAQTWSEHCVHKTFKSRVRYRAIGGDAGRSGSGGDDPIRWEGRPGVTVEADGTIVIDNLLRSTVAAATHELIAGGVDWALSVFKDNAGVIAFDQTHAVCVKVETHNHPSAIEPYGGAATGVGGCIRDVMGTGLGAKPIANTDVFCVARPDRWSAGDDELGSAGGAGNEGGSPARRTPLPPGTLHPRRVLTDVVAGVRDYGNRMGIPTVNGAVWFDDRYVGNPLVFCGCVGLMARNLISGKARAGDVIVALGGRTGRDGIHGATFSSAELEGTSADEFSHAVQIGNAIEEKRVLDVILRAQRGERGSGDASGACEKRGNEGERDQGSGGAGPLFHAITDCGAGGFSSAIGEMGAELGAEVHLDRAPLKYAGLTYTEVWISEAQERMVLAVPPGNLPALRRICRDEGVGLAEMGRFGTPGRDVVLMFGGAEVGRLDGRFLHEGLPQPTREAEWRPTRRGAAGPTEVYARPRSHVGESLLSLLAHPNIASKHWIIRQYDHEVQGNTVLKPLVGPGGRGPGDAAVIEPVPGTGRGLAIACGLQTGVGDPAVGGDPYVMALAAIDECVRNLVCVGADPGQIAILDNFCWPSCAQPENLGALVRAAVGCYDGAKAYRTPFVSGKDSLNNQLRYTDPATGEPRLIEVPPTLLISGIGVVPRLERVVTMEAKRAGNVLVLVGRGGDEMGGSHYERLVADCGVPEVAAGRVPRVDLAEGPRAAHAVAELIRGGLVHAAHDCSDGGLLVAIAEMLIGASPAGLGAELDLGAVHRSPIAAAFAESPSRYVLEVEPGRLEEIRRHLRGVPFTVLGSITGSGSLRWPAGGVEIGVDRLISAWTAPLDW